MAALTLIKLPCNLACCISYVPQLASANVCIPHLFPQKRYQASDMLWSWNLYIRLVNQICSLTKDDDRWLHKHDYMNGIYFSHQKRNLMTSTKLKNDFNTPIQSVKETYWWQFQLHIIPTTLEMEMLSISLSF